MLHCIVQASTKGGDSTLSDAFSVATVMKVEHPDMYRLLTTVPIYTYEGTALKRAATEETFIPAVKSPVITYV